MTSPNANGIETNHIRNCCIETVNCCANGFRPENTEKPVCLDRGKRVEGNNNSACVEFSGKK